MNSFLSLYQRQFRGSSRYLCGTGGRSHPDGVPLQQPPFRARV